jgi:hypothetical protein
MGDVFVVCSYDEISSMYVPILARTKRHGIAQFEGTSSKYYDYYQKYGIDIKTSYYDKISGYDANGNPQYQKVAYPIIAKGIIGTGGLPTAIRIEDGVVKYYRTNVTTLTSIDENAVVAMAAVTEVNTVGFTNYVESTAYKRVSGSTSNTKSLFNSSFDLKTELKSDVGHYFVQDTIVYSLMVDELGGGSVYDNFSAFFTISGQTFILLVLGISSILTILFKATAAVIRRIFDIMVLVLIGPLAISARAIGSKPNAEGKDAGVGEKIFTNWKIWKFLIWIEIVCNICLRKSGC